MPNWAVGMPDRVYDGNIPKSDILIGIPGMLADMLARRTTGSIA